MTFRPYTVARYGLYAAAFVAVLSVYIGRQAGASFEFTLLRAVVVFVIVTALGLGAEAVLSFEANTAKPLSGAALPPSESEPKPEHHPEGSTE